MQMLDLKKRRYDLDTFPSFIPFAIQTQSDYNFLS